MEKMRRRSMILAWLFVVSLLAGCGGGTPAGESTPVPETPPVVESAPAETPDIAGTYPVEGEPSAPIYTDAGTGEGTTAGETWLDPDGTYSSAEDVALYIATYGDLPDNFITKNEARDLGWTGGGLDRYAPGKCIGGDKFGNREGLLPKGNYHECDINTLGETSRGAERLVWDDEGNIYYTNDHYESFELLYSDYVYVGNAD